MSRSIVPMALSAARIALISCACVGFIQLASAEVLITKDEAALPSAAAIDMTFRGVTRAPKVQIVSPKPNEQDVVSPVNIVCKFQVFGGSSIDPESVKFTYMKKPSVDLTKRLKAFIKKDGVEMPAAEVPPGQHAIRVDLQDSEGRASTSFLTFTVKQ